MRWLCFNSRVTVEGWTPIASAIDFFEHFLCSNTEIQVLVLASPLPENCTSILNLGVDRGHYDRLIRHKYLKMRPFKKIFFQMGE